MVQLSIDTGKESLEELEAALQMLQSAIMKKKGAAPQEELVSPAASVAAMDMPGQEDQEETVLDAGFLKITSKSDEPANIREAVAKIAEIKKIDPEECANAIYMNYQRLFL